MKFQDVPVLAIMFLLMMILVLAFTGCTSLPKTCDRFGMDTEYVLVKSTESETLGETKTVTQFKCAPRKYKSKTY